MTIAKKCDRCGALYEAFLFPQNDAWRYNVTKDCHPYPDIITLDLCYNCKCELEKWIKGYKKEGE